MKGGETKGQVDSGDDEPDDIKVDIKGMRISGQDNYFEKRRRKYEPTIFSKSAPKGYTAYSKNCQWANRRQPILITDEEKKEIDELDNAEGMKSYNGVLSYKSKNSKDNKKYNYICPRFWCIKDPIKKNGKNMTNKSLSLKQVDNGECGGWDAVMRDNVKKVPEGKYIYEFSDTRMHRSEQKIPHYDENNGDSKKIAYRPMYPDFAKSKKIAPGLCAPCCQRMPVQGTGIELDSKKQFNYFDPEKHKELQKRKDEWMTKTKDGMKINFEKFEKLDEYKNEYEKNDEQKVARVNDLKLYGNINDKKPLHCKNQKDGEVGRTTTSMGSNNTNFPDKTPSYNFPLQENQLGYMNIYLQDFLNFDNKSICYKNKDENDAKYLKEDTPCLLRMGIEKNNKQSFLYLLSNVYEFYDNKDEEKGNNYLPTKNINDFKKYFIENLTIDKFVSAQNGILPKLFAKNIDDIVDEKIKKYNDSIYFGNVTEKKIKKRIISAYENFIEYISDENEEIDYKYIWDLVCKPKGNGGVLFKNGINLLIFKETNDDMTFNKIEIICPMNYYSNNFFDDNKKTLMVVTNGYFYEPLCSVRLNKKEKKSKWMIKRFFSRYKNKNGEISMDWKYTAWENAKLYDTISLIKENLLKYCQAKESVRNNIYDYNTNISFKKLKEILLPEGKINIHQIFNSNNKIVGGLYKFDKINNKYIYIPTHPSPIDTSLSMKYINNLQEYYLDYKTTKEQLEELKTMGIPCKPKSKILENTFIVGIKTETNQFVPVLPIENNETDDGLEEEENYIKKNDEENYIKKNDKEYSNEYQLDEYIINNNTRDDAMLKVVKGIKLENNFYTMFRNTLKIILSDKKYKDKKEEMKNIINNKTKTYIENFEILRNKLIELLSTAIEFIETELDTIEDFEELISCFGIDKGSCKSEEGEKNVGCFLRKNICSLILPKFNLFNSEDNESLYYNKLTDELLRFQKIKNYIFTEREYLSFDNVNYKVNDNEIILLEGILLNTYLNKNLILAKNNKYVVNDSIYELIPAQNPLGYITNVNWNEKRKLDYSDEGDINREKWVSTECDKEITNDNISKLNIIFNNPSEMKLYEYDYGKCKFVLIEKIIKNHLPDENISIDIIKNRLIDEHKKLIMPNHNINSKGNVHSLVKSYITKKNDKLCKLISLLYALNKERNKFNEIEDESKTDDEKNEIIKGHIMNDNYNVTDFEIFLILKSYNIPALIISPSMSGTVLNKIKKIFNTDIDSNEYYVIVHRKKKVKEMKKKVLCVYTHNNSMKINKNLMLNEELKKSVINIEKYIKDSVKKMKDKRIQTLEKDKKQKSSMKIGKRRLPSE